MRERIGIRTVTQSCQSADLRSGWRSNGVFRGLLGGAKCFSSAGSGRHLAAIELPAHGAPQFALPLDIGLATLGTAIRRVTQFVAQQLFEVNFWPLWFFLLQGV